MSNARVFCIGWVASALMRFAAEWLGYGPEPGLVAMAKGIMLGLTFGITAVAMFGDRRLAHPTHTNDRGES